MRAEEGLAIKNAARAKPKGNTCGTGHASYRSLAGFRTVFNVRISKGGAKSIQQC
jgi:hypothetical protein